MTGNAFLNLDGSGSSGNANMDAQGGGKGPSSALTSGALELTDGDNVKRSASRLSANSGSGHEGTARNRTVPYTARTAVPFCTVRVGSLRYRVSLDAGCRSLTKDDRCMCGPRKQCVVHLAASQRAIVRKKTSGALLDASVQGSVQADGDETSVRSISIVTDYGGKQSLSNYQNATSNSAGSSSAHASNAGVLKRKRRHAALGWLTLHVAPPLSAERIII